MLSCFHFFREYIFFQCKLLYIYFFEWTAEREENRKKRWWWWTKLSIIILTLQLHSYLITRQPLHVATEWNACSRVCTCSLFYFFTMSSILHTHTLHCPHFFFSYFLASKKYLNLKPLDLRLIFSFLSFMSHHYFFTVHTY